MVRVRSLDAPLIVDDVVDDIERSIRTAILPPNSELSVHELSEQRGVRSSVLAMAMARLERECLITLHGDTVLVTPLDPREFRQIIQLRKMIHLSVYPQALSKIDPGTIDQLAALIPDELPLELPGDPTFRRRWSQMMAAVSQGLAAPAISTVERQLLGKTHRLSVRYNRLGWARLRQERLASSAEYVQLRQAHLGTIRELVAAFRAGRSSHVLELASRHADNATQTGEQSLVPQYLATTSPRPWTWAAPRRVPSPEPSQLIAERPSPPAPGDRPRLRRIK